MEKPYVVGIDIGGTNTVFGVVDARGTILYSGSIKTGKYADVNDYVAELAKGLKSVIDQAGGPGKIKGVGVMVLRTETFSTDVSNSLRTCLGKVRFLWLN